MDDDLDDDMSNNLGRGSWWRGVVGQRNGLEDDDSEDDDEEEFGDFAMAEEEKSGDGQDDDNVVLKPLAVHPPRESSRGLSGLWPFGSRDKGGKAEEGKEELKGEGEGEGQAAEERDDEPGKGAIEVREAQRRTSIEDDDDDDDANVGSEFGTDFKA